MRCRLSVKARGERTRILSSVSLHLVLSLLLNQEPGREAPERATALMLFRRTGPRSGTTDEGRIFIFSCSSRSSKRSSPAERNWHREAILACVSRLAKAKPLLAAGCSSRQKMESLFLRIQKNCRSCPEFDGPVGQVGVR